MIEEEGSLSALEQEEVILFHIEDIDFELEREESIRAWIRKTIELEAKQLVGLNFIFCSDAYLHSINLEYLNHDTYTDIITFPYLKAPEIQSDIFISIERILENAQAFDTSFKQELRRVIIHGVLHLCGYKDKTDEEAQLMRKKEDEALGRWKSPTL